MMFWLITAAMTALVALLLARALWRGSAPEEAAASYDLQVYRDQLADVERDVARGVVSAEDAERMRTEISRRILAADRAAGAAATTGSGPRPAALGITLATLLTVPFGVYAWLGAPGYGDFALADRIAYAEELRRNRPDQQTAEATEQDAGHPPKTNRNGYPLSKGRG